MTGNESCWSIEIVWLKSYNVKPCWCVTSSVHAEFAIRRKWCEWQWDKVRALLKGERSVFVSELNWLSCCQLGWENIAARKHQASLLSKLHPGGGNSIWFAMLGSIFVLAWPGLPWCPLQRPESCSIFRFTIYSMIFIVFRRRPRLPWCPLQRPEDCFIFRFTSYSMFFRVFKLLLSKLLCEVGPWHIVIFQFFIAFHLFLIVVQWFFIFFFVFH